MRKRVCLLTSVHSPFDFRIFSKECKSLVSAGYEVTLVAPHSKDEVVDGVSIKAMPKSEGRLSRITLTVWRVYREAVHQGADVYLFPDPELIPVGLLLQSQGKRVVYDVRELTPQQFLAKHYLPRWVRSFFGRLVECLQNFAVPRFSAVLAATPSIATQFQGTNQQNFVVIQNFPSPDELGPKDCLPWDQRPNWAVYVGGITVFRGIREMLSAMALLPETLQATLKLVGSFAPTNLKDEVSPLPGWKRTEYMGFVDRLNVWQVLGQARVGLLTLHPLPSHLGAWPVKLFEYMGAGIPVIASDFPLWREIVKGAGCGLLVDPLDPKAIAQAIEYLLTHPQEAELMGRRGREAVQTRYNWTLEEKKLLQLWEQLAKP